jgi:Cu/Zn superoxide dismutase
MKKTIRLAIGLLLAVGLFTGCDGDVTSSTPTVITTEAIAVIDTNVFDTATGAVTTETAIEAGDTGTTMSIPAGTVLQDIDGNPITEAPSLEVKAEKSATEASTTINFEVDGKKVVPTESVVFSVPAPDGAKAGDIVQIEVPDDGSITQKLIFVLVKADGTVDIRVFPAAFTKTIIIVVKVQADNSTN